MHGTFLFHTMSTHFRFIQRQLLNSGLDITSLMRPGIYVICNHVDDKVYVGKAKNLVGRIGFHVGKWFRGNEECKPQQEDFHRLGSESFSFHAFRQDVPEVDLSFEEEKALLIFRDRCYNVANLKRMETHLNKQVEINGKTYANPKAAAKALDLDVADVYFQCQSCGFETWTLPKGFKAGQGRALKVEFPPNSGVYAFFSSIKSAHLTTGLVTCTLTKRAWSNNLRAYWVKGAKQGRGYAIEVEIPQGSGTYFPFPSLIAARRATGLCR